VQCPVTPCPMSGPAAATELKRMPMEWDGTLGVNEIFPCAREEMGLSAEDVLAQQRV
jgi:hypothetical protein